MDDKALSKSDLPEPLPLSETFSLPHDVTIPETEEGDDPLAVVKARGATHNPTPPGLKNF